MLRDGSLRVLPRELRWDAEVVRHRVELAFAEAGASVSTAQPVARVLVDADVRGHRSHRVQLVPMYLDRVRAGGIDPMAQPDVVRSNPIVTVLSANGGFGQVAVDQAARLCATRAREHGIAAVAVRTNNHVGMLAAYRQPFVDAGVVALVPNISGPSVAAQVGEWPGGKPSSGGRTRPMRRGTRTSVQANSDIDNVVAGQLIAIMSLIRLRTDH